MRGDKGKAVAMEKFWESIKEFFSSSFGEFLVHLLVAVLVLVIGWLLIKWFLRLLTRSKLAKKMDPSAFSFFRSAVSITLKVVLVLTAASIIGVPSASIIALIGSIGVAIGLALQGSLSNLAGGLMILLFKPFAVGDYIEPSGAEGGTVKDISIFYTTLLTIDNRTVVLPNGELSNKPLENYTKMDKRRLDMRFSVGYDSDIDQVKAVMQQVIDAQEKLHRDPVPFARLREQGDSALIFEMRAWCNTDDYWGCYFDINEQMKKAFDAAGLNIPYPQMDVHMVPPTGHVNPQQEASVAACSGDSQGMGHNQTSLPPS